MDTLLLDLDMWDLVVDAAGNIAVASAPYSITQDVASACRTFLSEVYYDTTLGVPYSTQILGQAPSLSLLKSRLEAAALTVPGVATATCYISGITDRGVQGQVQITDTSGATSVATL